MTVAQLIAQLVELDKSTYRVDVRCEHDGEDHLVLGVMQVIDGPRGSADGWVILETDME